MPSGSKFLIWEQQAAEEASLAVMVSGQVSTVTKKVSIVSDEVVALQVAFSAAEQAITGTITALNTSLTSAISNSISQQTTALQATQMAYGESTTNLLNQLDANNTNTITRLSKDTNATQQTLIEYIGQYVVIPLYKQRLNDISSLYFELLEKNIICKIEKYLLYFREPNFYALALEYPPSVQHKLGEEVLHIKKEAFKKFLSTTPGATCFNEMTEEAIKSYKSFRQYISWAYKTLDGLRKATILYNEFINLEGRLESVLIDSDILNDTEKLQIYIDELKASSNTTFALEETVAHFDVSKYVKLKPQYLEYLTRYGPPKNFQFDTEKMAIVIRDLICSGVMPAYAVSSVCTTSGLSGRSCDNTTENDSADLTVTASDTVTDAGVCSDGTATVTDAGVCSDGTAPVTDTATATDTATDTDADPREEGGEYSLSGSELSGFEKDVACEITTYFVYISSSTDDAPHVYDTYYYPLYLEKSCAENAIDVSHANYNSTIDVWDNNYTPNDSSDPEGVTPITFPSLGGVVLWMPNSCAYRSVGTTQHPPSGLEYVRFTQSTNCA